MVNSLRLPMGYVIRVAGFEIKNNHLRFSCEAKLTIHKCYQYLLNTSYP